MIYVCDLHFNFGRFFAIILLPGLLLVVLLDLLELEVVPLPLLNLLGLLQLEVRHRLLQALYRVFLRVGRRRELLQVFQRRDHLLHEFRHVLGAVAVDQALELFAWKS